ncbi:hypothetical protein LguiA_002491 [Lonicera macranthoides]
MDDFRIAAESFGNENNIGSCEIGLTILALCSVTRTTTTMPTASKFFNICGNDALEIRIIVGTQLAVDTVVGEGMLSQEFESSGILQMQHFKGMFRPENEWSRTDPTEPCSLSPTPVITANDSSKPSSSPPISQAASLSPAMENMESKEERKGNVEEDDDDEFCWSDRRK